MRFATRFWPGLATALGLCSGLGLGAGCDESLDQVEVELCGQVDVPAQLDAVRVVILDADRQEVRAGVRELVDCATKTIRPLSQRLSFSLPADDELWFVAQGLRDGVEVMRFERRYRRSAGESTVKLGLVASCLGLSCPLGQTCIDGLCEIAPWQDPAGVCTDGAAMMNVEEMGQAMPVDMGAPQSADDMGQTAPPSLIDQLCQQDEL